MKIDSRIKLIFSMSLPLMVQNIVQHLQMVIDRAFLGNLNPIYLSAIGNVMTPYNAVGVFLGALSTGLTILVAQNIGAKNYENVKIFSESSFVFATLLSTFLFLMWLIGAESIFTFLGTQGEIKEAASIYVKIMAVSLIFTGADITAASVLSGSGYNFPIMVTGLIKNFLNIIFAWCLIYGNLGFPALGLEGAAIATLGSNVIGSLSLILWTVRTKKLSFHFSLSGLLKPRWDWFIRTMKLGLPSGIESVLWFVGQLFILRMMNGINPLAAGVLSLVQSVSLLALFVYLGFARASMTLVGQAWGAANFAEARLNALTCQFLGLGISFLWGLVMFIFPEFLCGLFSKDLLIISESVPMLRLSALFIFFQSINVIIGHAIRGAGNTRWMLYSQIAGTVFVIIFSYLMIFPFHLGLAGLFLTLILDEGLRGFFNLLKFTRIVNRKMGAAAL